MKIYRQVNCVNIVFCTKFQLKIQKIEFFRGGVTFQTYECLLLPLLRMLQMLFRGEAPTCLWAGSAGCASALGRLAHAR